MLDVLHFGFWYLCLRWVFVGACGRQMRLTLSKALGLWHRWSRWSGSMRGPCRSRRNWRISAGLRKFAVQRTNPHSQLQMKNNKGYDNAGSFFPRFARNHRYTSNVSADNSGMKNCIVLFNPNCAFLWHCVGNDASGNHNWK
ncbi:hypothetical protein TcasGA2_TC011956 [Tribolium castaneum]|uniref:Uncharacterized protein n=1 Tax=Tribolium castaneum TaxID=7070 RepID=D6X310_TRICA|nr:hypothetical protein TcasGA2_TC011956 [Tribolium castaneum]